MKRLYNVCVLSLSTNELTMWVEHEKKPVLTTLIDIVISL